MIQNVHALQEAIRSELVMGEVGTATLEFLVAPLFTIHVVML
jgi:hypothetical protein